VKLTNFAYAIVTAIGLAAAVPATPACAAGFFETFISYTGLDTNNCSDENQACATLGRAVSQTSNGGIVHCINEGHFSNATLTQNITVDCSNVVASVSNLVVNTPGITVRLVGLQVFGLTGIIFSQGAALYVEKCSFIDATSNGIAFTPSNAAKLFVSDSYFTGNGLGNSSLSAGIYVAPASGFTAQVAISNSRFENNQFGIIADGNQGGAIVGTVSNSVIAGNIGNGITASTATSNGANISLLVDQSQVIGNGNGGLVAGGSNAGMLVRNTSAIGNGVGVQSNRGGGLFSYLNNSVNGNTNDGAFTGTVGLK
jgi:hypothetical protein